MAFVIEKFEGANCAGGGHHSSTGTRYQSKSLRGGQRIVAEIEGYQKSSTAPARPRTLTDPHPSTRWPNEDSEICVFSGGRLGAFEKTFLSKAHAVYEQSHAIANDFSEFRYFIDKESSTKRGLCARNYMSCSVR